MSNIVAFKRKPALPNIEELPPIAQSNQAVLQFVVDSIYPWAYDNNIDTETFEFKLELATISTVLQGMMYRAEK